MVRWLKIALCSGFLICSGVSQATVLRAPMNVSLTNVPAALASRDLNWNLAPDVVVVNSTANSVTVIDSSTFAGSGSTVDYPVGTTPKGVALADYSGDGNIDIAVANQGSSSISILTKTAASGITFNAAASYSTGGGSSPVALAAGLFDSDLFYDLAVVDQTNNAVLVMINNGSGGFPSTVSYGVGSSPVAVAVADLDGQNGPDLVVVNQGGNSVSVLLNNGNGTFSAASGYAVGNGPTALALLDVDGNGTTDIAVANGTDGTVSWLSNDGSGIFTAMTAYTVGTSPASLVAADMNGDGYDDLAVANSGSDTVSLLENNRDGTFTVTPTAATVGTTPVAIAAADMNLDGHNDLLTANSGSSNLSLLINDTDFNPDQFTFTDQSDVALNSVIESNAVTLTGLNGWGRITVTGGQYAVSTDGGATWSVWSSNSPAAATVGDQIKLRTISSSQGHGVVDVQLTVGSVQDTFTVTTHGDDLPDAFTFTDQSGVALNATIYSNVITITGIDIPSSITVSGGQYSVNGGSYTSASGKVANGDTVQLLVTSPALYGKSVSMQVTIGGLSDTFTVTSMTKSAAGGGGGGSVDLAWLGLLLLGMVRRRSSAGL